MSRAINSKWVVREKDEISDNYWVTNSHPWNCLRDHLEH